jgi:hypothetical protein
MRIDLELAKFRSSVELDLAKIEIAARKEVLLRLIDLSQHVFDRKIDAYQSSYNDMMAFYREERAQLLERQSTLVARVYDPSLSQDRFPAVQQELSEVRRNIDRLDGAAKELTERFNTLVSTTAANSHHLRLR